MLGDVIVHSPSDLSAVATCEFATLRRLDEQLGRVAARERQVDPVLERTAALGDAHERHELDLLLQRYGPFDREAGRGVARLGWPAGTVEALVAARDATIDALRSGADAVHQATFFDGRLRGHADFLVRDDQGRWEVWDTKLARHSTVDALLQVAAYADQLELAGFEVAPEAVLRLGDRSTARHRLVDLLPVYRDRRRRLERLLEEHRSATAPVAWDEAGLRVCGRCADCDAEVERRRDLLLVARLRGSQRRRLLDAGVATIDDLAVLERPVAGLTGTALDGLRTQARLQVAQHPPGGPDGPPLAEVVDEEALRALPAPSPGDVFFDFEGDPLWSGGEGDDWGLEYLFGALVPDGERGTFTPWWAHDRPGERAALRGFLDWLAERRRVHPDLHVYHYADYERSALLRLAARHATGEEEVDDLLRAGVLVDLYATVRASVRVSQRSYSIKSLEPLYMGDDLRSGDVTTAADSMVAHPMLLDARAAGDDASADALQRSIADYNAYDCLSTWRLRDWLLGLVDRTVDEPGASAPVDPRDPRPDPHEGVVTWLAMHTGTAGERSADQLALAALSAAIGYHRREAKPYWWSWFERLREPVEELAADADVLVALDARTAEPWGLTSAKQKKQRRVVELTTRLAEGSGVRVGAKVRGLYDSAEPAMKRPSIDGRAVGGSARVVDLQVDVDGRAVVRVEEMLDAEPYDARPVAFVPDDAPPGADKIAEAAADLAAEVLSSLPTLPAGPAVDVARRRPPRLLGGRGLPEVADRPDGYVDAVTDAVRALDRSYLAVQGPPGSGKTHVGSHVVARLVAEGWSVGVVAQSHAVVENLLERVVAAGVDPDLVAKVASGVAPTSWAPTATTQYARFIADHAGAGCVVGGTAWTFANADQVPRGSLDLLVVEEAGQFSLANTIGDSLAAPRLLLLGDPQQLPQVTQGTHPVPVDTSALAWVAGDHETLPAHLGYFLERSWRLHSALCEKVSRLSYEGRLHAQVEVTDARHLEGVRPGVHEVLVEHAGRSSSSPEEADAVVDLVRRHLGARWTDGTTGALGQRDVLVVAPYNAQVRLLADRLASAGLGDVQVGTVDRFQGREAAVVVLSMTASSADDVPRRLDFLLSRNRLNVAVSRGQWCAYVVRSPALTDHLPTSPARLAELGAFLGLLA
ncbi:MAG: TM0106 family RecB-like putative nuclease [Nocardioidaceae bacterium]|nr:TM0106 family RecB-like putative nuclease [Nocardioidaceae bacterium]